MIKISNLMELKMEGSFADANWSKIYIYIKFS